MLLPKKKLYLLVLGTLIGFPLIGIIVHSSFSDEPFVSIFTTGINPALEVPAGLLYGFISAICAWQLVRSSLMTPVRNFFSDIFQQLEMTKGEIILISFCAGVGEEILFRGVIQPLLGIWITSILFVAIHGYLNPFNWRLSIYGLLMCVIILGIGWMKETVGIYSCMAAHFVIDWYLLGKLTGKTE